MKARKVIYGIKFLNGNFAEIPQQPSGLKNSHFFRIVVKRNFGGCVLHKLTGNDAKAFDDFYAQLNSVLDLYTA